MVDLWWEDADADHIRTRSQRYPGALDIELAWTQQAAGDAYRVVRAPDPRSYIGHTRLIGYSPDAGCVLTIIVDPQDNSGVTAWKTRGPTCVPTSRAGRATMSNAEDRKARRERHAAIRAEIADEEDAAGMAEAAEYAAALEVPLHVRVSRDLDAELRRRADVAGMSTSALVRRLLTQAVHRGGGALSASETAEVETIARRVAREEFQDH